jgi:hypothetical protein
VRALSLPKYREVEPQYCEVRPDFGRAGAVDPAEALVAE